MNWLRRHIDFTWDGYASMLLAVAVFFLLLIPLIPSGFAEPLGVLEFVQAAIVVAGGVLAWSYGRDGKLSGDWRRFWTWSVWCWLLVLGRTFNWGRAFLGSAIPRERYRLVAIALVVGTVAHFFIAGCYRPTVALLRRVPLPFWLFFMGCVLFAGSEIAEHDRLGLHLPHALAETIEECLEAPVFLSLVLIARRLYRTASGLFAAGG